MAKKPVPIVVEEDEPEAEECPKCPPVGAPAWMATFADMATLLMAFFVLILSFAEFNQPKFKMVAGSLKNAFGVQRRVPVVEQPKGTNVIKLEFSPSPEPSVRKEITQETTETEKPEVKTPQSEDQALGGEKEQAADQEQQKAAQELAEALQQALQDGRVKAEMKNGEVVMTFDAPDPQSLPSQLNAADGMALVLTESLAKGTVLNAAHLTLVALTSATGAGTLSDPARAIGRRLRGNLGAGQLLLARHLEYDYAVTQGMSVTITNEIRGIRIETAGEALDSGQLGEPIRVANRSSGRILRAIVSGPNKVTLAPNIR